MYRSACASIVFGFVRDLQELGQAPVLIAIVFPSMSIFLARELKPE